MSNVQRKTKKPKRPMTAYNFFFQVQRRKILFKEHDVSDERSTRECKTIKDLPKSKQKVNIEPINDPNITLTGTKASLTKTDSEICVKSGTAASRKRTREKIGFEKLGRLIAEKWKHAKDEEVEIYYAMAEEDSKRYRKEMDKYHEDEITSICMGYNQTTRGNDAVSNISTTCNYKSNYSKDDDKMSLNNGPLSRTKKTCKHKSNSAEEIRTHESPTRKYDATASNLSAINELAIVQHVLGLYQNHNSRGGSS